MDINTLIQTLQSAIPQIAESCCIVNGAIMNLDEVKNMGYNEFSMRTKLNMPLKLYKYFPNRTTSLIDEKSGKPIIDEKTGETKIVNYNIQSLRDNTVFMQSPSLFDDVYYSDISLDYNDYEKIRLLEYCKRCELNVCDSMTTQELGNALLQYIGNHCFSFSKISIRSVY